MSADRLRAVVLDFDGVVLESNDAKTEAFAQVFSRYPEHAAVMMAFHHANMSASRFVKFNYLIRHLLGLSESEPLLGELAADFSARTVDTLSKVPFVAGVEAFLREFAPRVPLYLASVTPQKDLEMIVARRGIGTFFRRIYGCPPWTKPDAVRDVLRIEGVEPGSVILVGDSPGDEDTAAETGVEFLARDSGISFPAPPRHLHADMHAVAAAIRLRLS